MTQYGDTRETYTVESEGENIVIRGSFILRLPDGRVAVKCEEGIYASDKSSIENMTLESLREASR